MKGEGLQQGKRMGCSSRRGLKREGRESNLEERKNWIKSGVGGISRGQSRRENENGMC